MPRTYRPTASLESGTTNVPIGGWFKDRQKENGDPIEGYGLPKRGPTGRGYSLSHLFLAAATLLSALICLGLREEQLRDYLVTAETKGCHDETLRAYLDMSSSQGEQAVVVGAIISGTLLLASMLVRTGAWYPDQGQDFGRMGVTITWYRVFSLVERILEIALLAMLVLAWNAEINDRPADDDEVAIGGAAAYAAAKAAGKCHADAPDSLEEALGPFGLYTSWAVALSSIYMLVVRIIGTEQRGILFDLDKLF